MEYLRADYTEVWTPSAVVPLIRFADRVRSIPNTGIDSWPPDLTGFGGFDDIVSWYGSKRDEFRELTCGRHIRFFPALPESSAQHACDFFAAQVGAPSGLTPRIDCPRRDDGFIAIHPFSGGRRKNWPLTYFEEVARRAPLPVRFTAGPEEPLDGAVRFEDLYELGCWLATATAYVGNDSGITHIAAAVGVPVIALFGPTVPAVWAPRGPLVHVLQMPATPDQVLDILSTICAERS